MPDDQSNLRRFYRLSYPVELRPKVTIGGVGYSVPEISEKGFRIACSDFSVFKIDDWISGMIVFKDDQKAKVSGQVFRHEKGQYVIAHVEGVTLKRLLTEQRLVINRFARP